MSDKLQRSKNWLVNQAIREFIARQEQVHSRWNETLAAMKPVAQGSTVPGEAVHAWLASWGRAEEMPPPKAGR